jgi:excisionase family DNA binding protein
MTADELGELRAVEHLLRGVTDARDAQPHRIFLSADGERAELPRPVFVLLDQVVRELLQGHAVGVVPLHKELTTQEAADLLGVSRPFLIGLLERGEVPYVTTGKHRRIRFSDLMEYKRRRDATRRQALDRLTELSQEYGLDRYRD